MSTSGPTLFDLFNSTMKLLQQKKLELLMDAVVKGNTKKVESLVKEGYSINGLDELGRAPLCIAVLRNDYAMVRKLVELGADVNAGAENALSIRFCAMHSDPKINLYLSNRGARLKKGEKPSKSSKKELKAINLHTATLHNDPLLVKLLLELKKDIDAVNDDFETPLNVAIRLKRKGIAILLIKCGADLGYTGKTCSIPKIPLIEAINEELDIVVEALLKKDSSPEHLNYCGIGEVLTPPPMLHAALLDDPKYLRMLIKAGADINIKNTDYENGEVFLGETPLIAASRSGYINNVKVLLEAGARLDEQDEEGNTALDVAQDYDQKEIAEILKEAAKTPRALFFRELLASVNAAKNREATPPYGSDSDDSTVILSSDDESDSDSAVDVRRSRSPR